MAHCYTKPKSAFGSGFQKSATLVCIGGEDCSEKPASLLLLRTRETHGADEMRAGFYRDLESLQGKNRTYYTGAFVRETVS